MAGIIINMSKVKQVLRLHAQGISNRKIAGDLGLYKGTVNTYVRKIKEQESSIEELLALDEPVLESKLFAGNPAYKQDRFEEFKGMISYREEELKKPHVTRHLLWEEYRESHPDGYGYSQFCFHLGQIIKARKPGSILQHHAGEKLFVDFAGDAVSYINRESGEVIQTQVFVACLPYYRCNSREIALGMFIAAFRIIFFGGDKLIVVIKYIVLLFRRQLSCLHQQFNHQPVHWQVDIEIVFDIGFGNDGFFFRYQLFLHS
jgi:transposase